MPRTSLLPTTIAQALRQGVPLTAEQVREASVQLECLGRIHAELSGVEWNADTPQNIADYLGAVGLDVEAFDEDQHVPA